MPPRKAQEKAIERAKLQEVREVTITFRATEEAQRLHKGLTEIQRAGR